MRRPLPALHSTHSQWVHLARHRGELAVLVELEAAFQVFARGCYVADARYFRRRILTMSRRDVHSAVAKILTHIPARRYV